MGEVEGGAQVNVLMWSNIHHGWFGTTLPMEVRITDNWRRRSKQLSATFLLVAPDGSAAICERGEETRYPSEAAARMAWEMTHG